MTPQKRSLGFFPSQPKAFAKCEEGIRLRDANPGEVLGVKSGLTPDDLLATHFRWITSQYDSKAKMWLTLVDTCYTKMSYRGCRIVAVSDKFLRKSRLERVAMVYEALLEGLSQPAYVPPGMTSSAYADERRIRGFSGAVGKHVLSLPIFRNLEALQCALLIIECKTPGR